MNSYRCIALLKMLLILLLLGRTAFAVPKEISEDLAQPRINRIDRSLATVPKDLKNALRKLFGQRTLAIADRGARFRETDVVVDEATGKLPTRRFVLAFATPRFYYMYYRAGGYENAGKLIAFTRANRAHKFFWGGVEFEGDPLTVEEVVRRVHSKSFDDSKKYFW